MSLFQPQPGFCCVCGQPGEYEPHSSRGFICSHKCHGEWEWRYALYVMGTKYYPRNTPPPPVPTSPAVELAQAAEFLNETPPETHEWW